MLRNIPKSADAYHALYRDTTLVLKAGGRELTGESLRMLTKQIAVLMEQKIRMLLIFGGGPQIDARWRANHSEQRPKKDGIGITSPEVLRDAVLPAYADVRAALTELLPSLHIIEPAQLRCEQMDDYGLVGNPVRINDLDRHPLAAIGFVGRDNASELNVNGDDIIRTLVEQEREKINEVIFITGTKGVLDTQGRLAPLLLSHDIEAILADRHRFVRVDGGMKKKIRETGTMLPIVGKIAMTDVAGLKDEIEQWRGSGTLFVDPHQLTVVAMNSAEENIFDAVYAEYVERGFFRQRSSPELQELKKNHYLLRIKNSPLGGFSLLQRENGWCEMAALWTGNLQNGIGKFLAAHAMSEAKNKQISVLYALSAPKNQEAVQATVHRFTGYGFALQGPLSDVRQHNALPQQLQQYNTDIRNPLIFTVRIGM